MNEDALQWFAEAAHAFCDAVHLAGERPLEERVGALASALAALYLAGLHLPDAPDPPSVSPPLPDLPEDWPGLGAYEQYEAVVQHQVLERWLSEDLADIYSAVAGGLLLLDRGLEPAATWWRESFVREWGAVALLALTPLHQAVLAFRVERRRRRGPRIPEIVRLAPPEPDASQPFLGIRLAESAGGVEVVDVHPQGPAVGRLQIGDLLVSVDGESLGGLGLEDVRALLTGEIGARRILEVYRGDETVTTELVVGARAAREAEPAGRVVVVSVLHAEGALRAAQALRLLGCRITLEDDRLRIQAPATLEDADLRTLLEAGASAGVWRPA